MSSLNSNRYHKATNSHIVIGQPITNSIYSQSGKLLLKKGQHVISKRQLSALLENGYLDPNEPETETSFYSQKPGQSQELLRKYLHKKLAENLTSKRSLREIQSRIWASYQDDRILIAGATSSSQNDNLVEIKAALLDSLRYAFKLLDSNHLETFKFSIKSLALTIQYLCAKHQDRLLGALHLDPESHYSLSHPLKRAVICELIAKRASFNETERLTMVCGALTCDISFIGMQNKLAKQTGPLTDEQWEAIKCHPVKSEKKLLAAGVDDLIWLNIVRHHHERADGSGYPDSLREDDIPQETKIVAMADVYSAMVKPTSFRSEKTANKVLKLLYAERNKTFDSNTINLLIKVLGLYPSGTLVKLKNNEIAVVVKNGKNAKTPIVQVLTKPDGALNLTKIERDTRHPDCKIITALPLSKYNILRQQLQKVWGGYK